MIRYPVARTIKSTLAVGAITAASGAVAVHAQVPTSTSSGENLQEVVVTGSIIKRTDFDTPSPVQVISAEDLQKTGFTSVSEVLRNLASNGQGTLSQSFNFAFAGGGSGVALRGLTVGGTLTLVDGARMIPYPLTDDSQRNFVDITQIPFNVIDRIDVLKDGASAEYGSDAIAGVVNVVLKKSYTGTSIKADAGTADQHGTTEHLAGIWGVGNLASDGYNTYLSAEFRHQDRILVGDRHGFWATQDWTPYGGFNTQPGASDSGFARPRIPGGYVLDPATNVIDAGTVFLNPAACSNFAAYSANKCVYNGRDQLQPQAGNVDVLGRFTKTLGGNWQASVTGSWFRSLAEQVGGANDAGVSGSPFTAFGYAPGVNPFAVTSPRVLLPVGAPNNPFNAPARLISEYFPQLGDPETQFVTNTYRLFGNINGSVAGWDVDGIAGYMYSALTQKSTGFINRNALAAAAAADFNFVTATTAQMESAFAPPGEVKDTDNMEVVDLHATRPLFNLPGGPLSMALGAGYNHLYRDSRAPAGVENGTQGFNGAYVVGGQSNTNAYIEFAAPVVRGLEIDLSGRYDHYPQYGSSETPKFGVKYSPFRMLTLRGTYGKGFRAPNAAESGTAASAFSGAAIYDTALCPDHTNPFGPNSFPGECAELTGLQIATKTLQPEKSTNWTTGLIFSPFGKTSISLDYWDIKVNQDIQSGTSLFFLGADPSLFPIVYGQQLVETFCTAQNVCNTQRLTPAPGPILYVAFPYYNLTQTHVNGLDLDVLSRWNLGNGRLSFQFNGTYMFHYIFGLQGATFDLAGTHGPSIVSGDTGNPKIRGVTSLSWDQGPINVTATVNYVGRFNLTDPTAGEPDCATAIGAGGVFGSRFGTPNQFILDHYCEVHSFTDVDLYAQYAVTSRLAIHASILNALNSQPPIDLTTYGAADDLAYNPAMHQAGAIGRFYNLGASYTF